MKNVELATGRLRMGAPHIVDVCETTENRSPFAPPYRIIATLNRAENRLDDAIREASEFMEWAREHSIVPIPPAWMSQAIDERTRERDDAWSTFVGRYEYHLSCMWDWDGLNGLPGNPYRQLLRHTRSYSIPITYPALGAWALTRDAKEHHRLTLGCHCYSPEHCHRRLLANHLAALPTERLDVLGVRFVLLDEHE